MFLSVNKYALMLQFDYNVQSNDTALRYCVECSYSRLFKIHVKCHVYTQLTSDAGMENHCSKVNLH